MPRALCSMATDGTVVVVDALGVAVEVGFATVVGAGFAMVVVVLAGALGCFATVVVAAIAARVLVVMVTSEAGDAPVMVVFRLALPWKTARIFLEVELSRSGTMTDMSSIIVPLPGMV